MRRWRFLLPGLALLAGCHFYYWHWMSQQLLAGFDLWVAQRRAEGWTVLADTPARGGWPGNAILIILNCVLAHGFTWEAERVVLRIDLLRPTALHIQPERAQLLRLPDHPDIRLDADRLRVSLPLDPQAGRAEVVVENLRAQRIDLARYLPSEIGSQLDLLRLDTTLNGAVPDAATLADAARQWRDSGGMLSVGALHLRMGEVALAGHFTLSLDDQLRPVGSGILRVAGHAVLLDALVAAKLLPQAAALATRAMVRILPQSTMPDGATAVEIPLALKDGILSLHQIPLVRLPPLVWPDR